VTMFIRSQVSCDDCHDPCAVFLWWLGGWRRSKGHLSSCLECLIRCILLIPEISWMGHRSNGTGAGRYCYGNGTWGGRHRCPRGRAPWSLVSFFPYKKLELRCKMNHGFYLKMESPVLCAKL
jgi:hypothetical protein